MKMKLFLLCSIVTSLTARFGSADNVTWTIDQAQSYIRISIPDQMINIGSESSPVNIMAALRGAQPVYNPGGAGNPSVVPWTDDRGALAPVAGTLLTDYVEGSSLTFINSGHNAQVVETGMWIPNRNFWNDATDDFDYHQPQFDGHSAAFATELTLSGVVRVGHVTLYDVGIHADGTVTLSGGGGTWNQSGGSLVVGGADNNRFDFWALALTDSARSTNAPATGVNNGSLVVEDVGGNQRKLTIPINVDFVLLINGLPLQNSKFIGQIVAYATLPSGEVVNSAVYHNGFAGSAIDTRAELAKEGDGPQALSLTNMINSSNGINGVAFDINGLGNANALNASDFEFQWSPQGAFNEGSNPPSGWGVVSSAPSISVNGTSPSQVLITWPNETIVNRWLRITIKATENTGLSEPEVYYVGHLLGEVSGADGGIYTVAFSDLSQIRTVTGQEATAGNLYDIDKSGLVSFADISEARVAVGAQLTNITIP